MWKTNDPIQQLRRSHQLTIQTEETRVKTYVDWRALQIHPNPKRSTSHHAQISPCIDDSEILETADTQRDPDPPLKKSNRIIVRNGKISTECVERQKTMETHEATHKKAVGQKRVEEKPSIQKLLQKMVEKDGEIERLKEETQNLKMKNKKLELQMISGVVERNPMQTVASMSALSQTDRKMNNVPSIALMTSCTDLSERSQDSEILKLRNDITRKDEELKAKDKQNQHEKNLLYQNINNRLKAKEIECYNANKDLRKQRLRIKELELKVEEYERDIEQLNQMINESAERIDGLSVRVKEYQQEESKRSIMLGRIRYLENQSVYSANEGKKQRAEIETLTKKSLELQGQNGQLKSQISVYLSNPLHAPHAQIYSLAKQLTQKDLSISYCQQQLKTLRPLKQQKQQLVLTNQKSSLLLQESNEELLKQRLIQLNLRFKNVRLY